MTLSLGSFGSVVPWGVAFLLYYNDMKKLILLLVLSQAVAHKGCPMKDNL